MHILVLTSMMDSVEGRTCACERERNFRFLLDCMRLEFSVATTPRGPQLLQSITKEYDRYSKLVKR